MANKSKKGKRSKKEKAKKEREEQFINFTNRLQVDPEEYIEKTKTDLSQEVYSVIDAEFVECEPKYDVDLLERARTFWQLGYWKSLTELGNDSIREHPSKAKIALFIAAGHQQLNNLNELKIWFKKAKKWGCSKSLISRLLISGVYNSLGKAAATSGQIELAKEYFKDSISIGSANSATRLVIRARVNQQLEQLKQSDPRGGKEAVTKITRRDNSDSQKHFTQIVAGILGTLFLNYASQEVDRISITYRERTLLSMSIRNGLDTCDDSFLKDLFFNEEMIEIIQNTKVSLAGKKGVFELSPENIEEVNIDERLIGELCQDLEEVNHEKYFQYIKANYARIYEDARIIQNALPKLSVSILDIGAIPPLLASLLTKFGFTDITIVDPAVNNFEKYLGSIGVKTIEGNVLEYPKALKDKKFDFVTLCEVIEHLTGDLREALKTITGCVRENGYLYVTTPNLKSIPGYLGLAYFGSGMASKYKETVKSQYDRIDRDGFYGHLREFTSEEIIDFICSYGFKHINSYYQPDYRTKKDPIDKLSYFFELAVPELRLFGRHIFQKTG